MIRKSVMLLGMLGVALFLLTACNSNSVIPVRPDGTVMGRVIDGSTDLPLAGVAVTITSSPFPSETADVQVIVKTATTDQNGLFDRSDIPEGEVEVGLQKDGYRTPDSQLWALTPGGTGSLAFTMYPGQDPPEKFSGDEQSAWPPNYQG